jgi:nitroreductase
VTSGSRNADTLLAARYGAEEELASGAWNEVLATLLDHRSVRNFRPEPLAPSILPTLVAAAQSASNSSNLQSWSVVAVQDSERKARLAALAANQSHIRQAPLFLVWLADLARNESIGRAQEMALDGVHYLETLFVAIIDTALAAQNAVIAAESLGLGTVYIGAIRNRPEQVAAELGLPKRVLPVFGLCIGHPDPAVPSSAKPRLPQAAVVHHETYDAAGQAAAVQTYEDRVCRFQAEQGQETVGWIKRTLQRLANREALNGRDRMREAIANLGFEIR